MVVPWPMKPALVIVVVPVPPTDSRLPLRELANIVPDDVAWEKVSCDVVADTPADGWVKAS